MKRLLFGLVGMMSVIALVGCSSKGGISEDEEIYYSSYRYPTYTYGYYSYPSYRYYGQYPYAYDYWRRSVYYYPRYSSRLNYRGGYYGGYHHYVPPRSYYGYRTYRYK